MGRVAHELKKQVAPGFGVKLEMVKAAELKSDFPKPEMTSGKLSGGQFVLTEPNPNSYFAAILTVAKQRSHL